MRAQRFGELAHLYTQVNDRGLVRGCVDLAHAHAAEAPGWRLRDRGPAHELGSSRLGLLVCVPLVSELLALLGDAGVGVVEALLVFGFELVAEPLRVS
jgi:hypothetical protein